MPKEEAGALTGPDQLRLSLINYLCLIRCSVSARHGVKQTRLLARSSSLLRRAEINVTCKERGGKKGIRRFNCAGVALWQHFIIRRLAEIISGDSYKGTILQTVPSQQLISQACYCIIYYIWPSLVAHIDSQTPFFLSFFFFTPTPPPLQCLLFRSQLVGLISKRCFCQNTRSHIEGKKCFSRLNLFYEEQKEKRTKKEEGGGGPDAILKSFP